jgi:phage repressor protein C with HTH and peptisase S24 domain/DNA-binding Xre family transcriptional regulator
MVINSAKFAFIRKSKNISHKYIADHFGITPPNVSNWENNKKDIPVKYYNELCKILNVKLEDLCDKPKVMFSLESDNHISQRQPVASDFTPDSEVRPVMPGELKAVPVISFAQAAGYEPSLEPFDDFARDCSDREEIFKNAKPGYFALDVNGDSMTPEYPHGSVLLVAGGEFPQRGDIVVAKLRDGQVIVKRYSRKDNVVKLESDNPNGQNFSWHCKEDPGYVQWMYPVIEVNIKLRAQRWERTKNGNH